MKEQIQSAILPGLPIVGHLKLSSFDGKTLSRIDVVKNHNASELSPFFKQCHQKLLAFLTGKTQDLDIPVDMAALSPFQQKILNVMRKISYGEVATYKDLALKINSRGYQAIGAACGKNPFLLIYPCHRVVSSKGLGGFAHGGKMKEQLLQLEQSKLSDS